MVRDHDREGADLLRNTAEHLLSGHEVIVLRRPHGIPDEWMPSLVQQMTAMLLVAAGEMEAVPIPEDF